MGLIQIRNVPDDVHRILKARAAAEGMSLSDYLLRDIERSARVPTPDELWERLRTREPTGITTAEIVNAIRDQRGE